VHRKWQKDTHAKSKCVIARLKSYHGCIEFFIWSGIYERIGIHFALSNLNLSISQAYVKEGEKKGKKKGMPFPWQPAQMMARTGGNLSKIKTVIVYVPFSLRLNL
jgi:hypothetical protein